MRFVLSVVALCALFAACGEARVVERDAGKAPDASVANPIDAAPEPAADAAPMIEDDAGTAFNDATTVFEDAAEPQHDGSVVSPELEAFILEKMRVASAPGLAAAIVKNGAVAWSAGFGDADIDAHRPVTPDSVFILASISKTPIAISAMELVENGSLDLDADISIYLPFQVENPNYRGEKITLRMLLTHTSSLLDSNEIDNHLSVGDSPISLRDFMEGYTSPDGAYYRSDNWSSTNAPGTYEEYSNSGASLAAYVVEAISGESYAQYARRTIFTPLGMNNTSYRLTDLDPARLATPYGGSAAAGYTSYGQYGYPDYPDGALRTSVTELARFMMMFMHGGDLDGTRIISAAGAQEISRAQNAAIDPDQGLIWYYIQYEGRRMIGHNGAYLGTSTDMYFDPTDGVGFIVLTNGDTYLSGTQAEVDALDAIERRLLQEAAGL